MARPVRLRVNPANTDQRLVLWDNGRWDAYGVPNPVTASPAPPAWYSWIGKGPAVDFAYDWSSGSGYVLDFYGGLHPFGGAGKTTVPPYLKPYAIYRALVMHPDMDGKGWALDARGVISAFGGATAIAGWGVTKWAGLYARRLVMDTTTREGFVLDGWGGVHQFGGAPAVGSTPGYWKGWDIARGLAIYDIVGGKGWKLDGWGGVHAVGGAASGAGGPYWRGWDIACDIAILDDGTGPDPLRLAVVDGLGPIHEWTVSAAPTVTLTGPDDPTTTTTRPTVSWDFADPDGDAQASYSGTVKQGSTLIVAFSGTDPAVRGYDLPVDLDNAAHTVEVTATDTSGKAAPADTLTWVQNVTRPAAPSITGSDNGDGTITVTVGVGSPPVGSVLVIEWRDADSPADEWYELRYTSSGTTHIDREARPGVARSYRAYTVVVDPWLASLMSSTVTVTLSRAATGWMLSAPTTGVAPLVLPPVDVEFSRPVVAQVFDVSGGGDAVVVTDGAPRSRRGPVTFRTVDQATYDALMALLEADGVLLLRDPVSSAAWWFRPVNQIGEQWIRAAPTGAEVAEGRPVRHARVVTVDAVVVARPDVDDATRPVVG